MSNSRSLRRRVQASHPAPKTGHRFPDRPPALGTVRRWIKAGVAEGTIESAGVEHTGKPGRPANLYQLSAKGKERAQSDRGTWKDLLTELQAKRAHALMKKGMSERRAIAAVTRGWTRPQGAAQPGGGR